MKERSSKKIAYCGACVAISQIGVLISAFTPVQIVPLILVSLALYVAFRRCGLVYGIISSIVCLGLTFAITGLRLSFVFVSLLFLPYAIVAYTMYRLSYFKPLHAVVRIAITAVIFAVAFLLIVNLFDLLTGTAIVTIINKIGLVPTTIVLVMACLPIDLFFSFGAEKIISMLK